jgi:hypothetical protein
MQPRTVIVGVPVGAYGYHRELHSLNFSLAIYFLLWRDRMGALFEVHDRQGDRIEHRLKALGMSEAERNA